MIEYKVRVYPDGTQTFLVFEVEDLITSMEYLKSKGVELDFKSNISRNEISAATRRRTIKL